MNPVSLNSRAHTHASARFSFPLLTPSVCLPLSPPQGLIQTPRGVLLPPQTLHPPSAPLPCSISGAVRQQQIFQTCKKILSLFAAVLCWVRLPERAHPASALSDGAKPGG